jgi:hypothetical protein
MTWYAIVDATTKDLRSLATVLADPMPRDLQVVPLPAEFDPRKITEIEWDRDNLSFRALPVIDPYAAVWARIMAIPAVSKLSAANQAALLAAIKGG